VQSGDTIFSIAQRYGIKPDTIAWSNDRGIVEGLRPGQELNILPIDGAYYTVSSQQSISSIAKQFNVDPYVIIDSEYNDLFGDTPDTQLPSNTKVVVPGGEAESIQWSVPVQHVAAGTKNSSGTISGEMISFDVGDPGSCGLVENPGGSGGWRKPLASYQWVRGFSSIHSGVDLADPIGTPIMAATPGNVIFSGWSNWGYGYSVVIASGPFTEIYGHMVSMPSARCGASISAGQIIGNVGMTGNATGPHLHFEIRYNDQPIDPTGIMAF
ncbi:MAG TPA: M23 family metallopeptidase, partial [Phototrophicaceae bacterium]|nr:M23 family metallopeptidase [Phototrophicaceae bacterium]